ncbi:MAG: M48 family metallopeptidase [Chloroflexota bacterium]
MLANSFFVVLLAALISEFALRMVADLLNLKALRLEPPADLADIYERDAYRNSQEYTRTNLRFHIAANAFMLAVILGFWLSGGFGFLDGLVRGWGLDPVPSGLAYIGLLVAGYALLGLPFSVYHTFVIEERFGFNRTTPRIFVLDRVKGFGLAGVVGGALLAGVLALFRYAGSYAWLYCWAAVTLFTLAMQFVVPRWVMPLFNRFTPMEEGELKDAILAYAGSVDFSVKDVYVMDGSKRSTKSNAFFTGLGRDRRVALFDTLIERHTIDELVAVLAHEVGHYKRKHVLKGVLLSVLHTGVFFFLLSLVLGAPGVYHALYVPQLSVYVGLVYMALLYGPLELFLSTIINAVSRKHEYEADRFAATTVRSPASLSRALRKLAADNFSNLTPHPFYVLLYYSHPPLRQRLRAMASERTE